MSTRDQPVAGSEPARGGWIDYLVVVFYCVLSAVIAVATQLYLPFYAGATPLPLSVLAAAIWVILAPRMCYRTTGSIFAAVAPVLVWFGMTAWLGTTRNEVSPGVPIGIQDWRQYLLIGVGGFCASASVMSLWAGVVRVRVRAAGIPVTPREPGTPVQRQPERQPRDDPSPRAVRNVASPERSPREE